MTLQPGSRIGQYEILGLLGVGGMGEVYRARDLRLGRDVALKTLPAALVADADRLARLEREARLLATINHPNVATIHGFENDHGVFALVMEVVEGETLEDRLRRAPPNKGLALRVVQHIAGQIAAALDAAHERASFIAISSRRTSSSRRMTASRYSTSASRSRWNADRTPLH